MEEKPIQLKETPNPKILRLTAVKEKTGWSRSSVYSLMAQKKFPQKVSLGARAIGWLSDEIDQYISSLIAARDTTAVNDPAAAPAKKTKGTHSRRPNDCAAE